MNTFKQISEVTEITAEQITELVTKFEEGEKDITIDLEEGEFRFIDSRDIDRIQTEELESDTYMLGCFDASFLSSIMDWPIEAIEATQSADKCDAIGEYLVSNRELLVDLQQEYASCDGYGHHFSHYDHSEEEIDYNGTMYHMFRIN